MDDVVACFTIIHCCDTIHDVIRPRMFPSFIVLGCDISQPPHFVLVCMGKKHDD